MELDALIVADAVSTPPDGKFYIHGGGISRVEVPMLPFPIPLGLLLRFKVDDEDFTRSHRVGVVLIGPAGLPNVPGVEFDLAAPDELPPSVDGEEHFVNIGLQLNGVAVRAGIHRLEVDLDGQRARTVPIPVIVAVGAEGAPVPREWPGQLVSGPANVPAATPPRRKPQQRRAR